MILAVLFAVLALVAQADVPAPVPPSPEKCGAIGGGIVAGLLILARIAHASGRFPWLVPVFEWLARRRDRKNPPTTPTPGPA